jgi:hypothetical protein
MERGGGVSETIARRRSSKCGCLWSVNSSMPDEDFSPCCRIILRRILSDIEHKKISSLVISFIQPFSAHFYESTKSILLARQAMYV